MLTSPAPNASGPERSRATRYTIANTATAAIAPKSESGIDEPTEGAAGAHGPELAVIAHQHDLGPGRFGGDQDPQQVRVGGHPRLVEDDHGAGVEREPPVVEPPQQRGEGAGLGDAGLPAEGAGGLARGGGADQLIAGELEGVAGRS